MGGRKAGRPGVSGELVRALEDGALVTLRQNIPGSDRVTGVIVGIGARWLAMAIVANEFDWDGWALIPLRSVRSCRRRESEPWGRFVNAVQKHRGTSIPLLPDLSLDDSAELIRSAAANFPVITVARDYARPGIVWIGVARVLDEQTVALRSVDPSGNWTDVPKLIDIADITRIDVGGDYEDALWIASRENVPVGAGDREQGV